MIELLSVFVAGTFWFWVMMSLAGIIFLTAVEKEKYFLAVCTTILLTFMYRQYIFSLSWETWAVGVPIYLVAGALWSIFSWHRLVVKKIEENKTNGYTSKHLSSTLAARNFQSRIISWLALWPFSVGWYFVRHLLGDLFKAIYDNLSDTYDGITKRALRKAGITDK